MTAVQVAGGCYLIHLGVAACFTSDTQRGAIPLHLDTTRRGFRMGLLVELSNPKSIAFFISIFAVAMPAEAAARVKATIVLGGFLVDVMWYGLASTLLSTKHVQRIYSRFAAIVERVLGTALAGFGLRIITEKL